MKKLAVIGCGNMGSAIVDSILNKKVFKAEELLIVEKETNAEVEKFSRKNIDVLKNIGKLEWGWEAVVIAVKPQDASRTLAEMASVINSRTTVISIMAGVSVKTLEKKSGSSRIIRCMPNTPCSINLGMTVYCGAPAVDAESFRLADKILSAMGKTFRVEDEKMIDAATAISGSGPAYLFYLAEAMKEGAAALGFSDYQAETLSRQTLLGASVLLDRSDDSAEQMRRKVSSSGGTTEAAISFYEKNNLKDTLVQGFHAAYRRSLELNKF